MGWKGKLTWEQYYSSNNKYSWDAPRSILSSAENEAYHSPSCYFGATTDVQQAFCIGLRIPHLGIKIISSAEWLQLLIWYHADVPPWTSQG
jgi:hypothetical protein